MSLIEAFEQQAETCTRMGSPFMGRLLRVLAAHWDHASALGEMMSAFSGDLGPAGHSLPLRICGGMHALVLTGRDKGLADVFPPQNPPQALLEERLLEALKQNEKFLVDWTSLPPQTNEIRRSAALIAMARVIVRHFDLPIVLSELGASGGLNLNWDRYALHINGVQLGPQTPAITLSPEWDGPTPPETMPVIASRAGVDLNPLDPHSADDLLRLTAYLWADQPERLDNTRRAAQVAHTKIDKGDAIDWLATRLADAPENHLHVIQHTVAWQYFPQEAQARGTALIEAAGQRATPQTPLAWMKMETDGDTTGAVGAALTVRLWPGDLTLNLGRADFHGRWVQWTGQP